MKFTVKRSEWYRGHGSTGSLLLRSDGTRCCIGFVGQQCGIPDVNLRLRADVISRVNPETEWPEWMQRTKSGLTDIEEAYRTNDSEQMDDAKREGKLKEIFARNGDEIEFVD